MYKNGSLELPAETVAENWNCLYFNGGVAFGIIQDTVLLHRREWYCKTNKQRGP
jgi:hypothetical protein